MFVQLDDGTVCLEVQVGGDRFILGDQIVGPNGIILLDAQLLCILFEGTQIRLGSTVSKLHGRTLSVFTKVRCSKRSRGLPELYVYLDGMLQTLKEIYMQIIYTVTTSCSISI